MLSTTAITAIRTTVATTGTAGGTVGRRFTSTTTTIRGIATPYPVTATAVATTGGRATKPVAASTTSGLLTAIITPGAMRGIAPLPIPQYVRQPGTCGARTTNGHYPTGTRATARGAYR